MILADKIIELRKKNGWSQEELAEMLDVSRQSISKYESAQTVPEMLKILKMAEVFGVTTDFLLKDEMGFEDMPRVEEAALQDPSCRKVSLKEANDFLSLKARYAGKIAACVMTCILSPVPLIFLGGLAEAQYCSETFASAVGLSALILMIASTIPVFVGSGLRMSEYEYMEKEAIETEYGVTGFAKDRKEQMQDRYSRNLVAGVLMCVLSVLPIFISIVSENELLSVLAVCFTLIMIAAGVCLMVKTGIPMEAVKQLLEIDDYTREKKKDRSRTSSASGAYWIAMTAIYLAISFITGAWNRTWIVWPVAGVSFPLYNFIVRAFLNTRSGS